MHLTDSLHRLRYCYEMDEEDEQFIREHLFTLDSSVSTPQVVIDVFEGANPLHITTELASTRAAACLKSPSNASVVSVMHRIAC